ncbi:protein of unknown function [Candidatus Methylocalor cossyra]|uniref:Uncharacterized protein n=1 Tax=Candidatus Methylocalor cossyra TaxID=3108543 RepID=A0ABM9NE86_9GAMM
MNKSIPNNLFPRQVALEERVWRRSLRDLHPLYRYRPEVLGKQRIEDLWPIPKTEGLVP